MSTNVLYFAEVALDEQKLKDFSWNAESSSFLEHKNVNNKMEGIKSTLYYSMDDRNFMSIAHYVEYDAPVNDIIDAYTLPELKKQWQTATRKVEVEGGKLEDGEDVGKIYSGTIEDPVIATETQYSRRK